MAPSVPYVRALYAPSHTKGPVPSGGDVIAVKRAIARAGFFKWEKFTGFYGNEIAEAVKKFQKSVGLPTTGVYTVQTHSKLRQTHSKAKPDQWAFDLVSIAMMEEASRKKKETDPLWRTREILAFCRKFDGPYVYGGEHDASFLDDDPHDGFDCSSSTSYVLWKFGLLGSNRAQVSEWFETWETSGLGKYMTVHANKDHVWIEFTLPEGYFRFDTSPHGDGPRGPRVRQSKRFISGFAHRHIEGF